MDVLLELVGYAGSALMLISMMMTSVKWLRIVNLTGAILSMIYGFLVPTLPTAFLNLGIMIIHLVQLWRLNRVKKEETT